MNSIYKIGFAAFAIALSGCAQEAISDDDAPAAQTKRASIDWDAARQDMKPRDGGETVQVAQSSDLAVPVLLPDIPFGAQTADGKDALRFRPMADGYYAVARKDAFDMIINGTDKLVARADADPAEASPMRFEETLTGAQVSFQRYGASYVIEFACKGDRADGCVSEEEAVAAVEELLVAGTR